MASGTWRVAGGGAIRLIAVWLTALACHGGHVEKTFQTNTPTAIEVRYQLYLPAGYTDDPGKSWPMILFLHGVGERGNDLAQVLLYGLPPYVESREDFPFVVVAPQCPLEADWDTETLYALTRHAGKLYRIDERRLYLTGISMGGFGTWDMACKYPDLFAAIAPVCGGGDPGKVDRIKHLPVWVFHGARDSLVPVQKADDMVHALQDVGGNVRYTRYEKVGHDAWNRAYPNADLYAWFLARKLPIP